jgi:hypothetical protein
MQFKQIKTQNDLKEMIQAAFDLALDVDGSWGYTKEEATILLSLPENTSPKQLQHTLASMRTYLEMHMTLSEEERYGSINITEKQRESLCINQINYDKVTYRVQAINEKMYAIFIQEYKEMYGKEGFDLGAHFQRREEATLKREITYWFDTSSLK